MSAHSEINALLDEMYGPNGTEHERIDATLRCYYCGRIWGVCAGEDRATVTIQVATVGQRVAHPSCLEQERINHTEIDQ